MNELQTFRQRASPAQAVAGTQFHKLRDAKSAALQEMERPPRKVTFFPVEDDGQLVGLVTLHGLVSAGL